MMTITFAGTPTATTISHCYIQRLLLLLLLTVSCYFLSFSLFSSFVLFFFWPFRNCAHRLHEMNESKSIMAVFFCCFVFRSLLLVGFLCTTVSLLFLKNINLLEYRVCIAHSSTELKPADQIAQLSKRMKHTVSAANRITRFWYMYVREKRKFFSFFSQCGRVYCAVVCHCC